MTSLFGRIAQLFTGKPKPQPAPAAPPPRPAAAQAPPSQSPPAQPPRPATPPPQPVATQPAASQANPQPAAGDGSIDALCDQLLTALKSGGAASAAAGLNRLAGMLEAEIARVRTHPTENTLRAAFDTQRNFLLAAQARGDTDALIREVVATKNLYKGRDYARWARFASALTTERARAGIWQD